MDLKSVPKLRAVIGVGVLTVLLVGAFLPYLRSGLASIDTAGDVLTTAGILLGLLTAAGTCLGVLLALPARALATGSTRVVHRFLVRGLPIALLGCALLLTGGRLLGDSPGWDDLAALVADPLFVAYWIILGGATLAALVRYWIVGPLWANHHHRLRVHHAEPGPDPRALTLWVSGRDVARLAADGGQYLHLRVLSAGSWPHRYRFALTRDAGWIDAEHGLLQITVRPDERRPALPPIGPDTRVWFTGPYALVEPIGFVPTPAPQPDPTGGQRTDPLTRDVVLVGIGHGTAAIRALLETLPFSPGRATVIVRATSADRAYLLTEIDALCRLRGAGLYVLLGHRGHFGDGSPSWLPTGKHAFRLRNFAPNLVDSEIFVCGPDAATELVLDDARADGVPLRQLHRSPRGS